MRRSAPTCASLKVARKAGLLPKRSISAYPTGRGEAVEVHFFRLSREDYFEAGY